MKKNEHPSPAAKVSSFILHTSSFLCVLCALCGPAFADEFSKVSHHAVRMFSYGTLTVDTRYGDLQIEGWDEPRLEIEAEKVVQAGSEAKAQPLYEMIRVDLEGQDKAVLLRTLYPPRRPWRMFRGGTKLSVNYRIKMPYDANLILKAVDGEVRIRGIAGNQKVRVSYGDVEVNVPSIYNLRSLNARTRLGYVQSNLHGEDNAGFGPRLWFWNPSGNQDIYIHVGMGGVYVYRED